jgi:hypothetical protein
MQGVLGDGLVVASPVRVWGSLGTIWIKIVHEMMG